MKGQQTAHLGSLTAPNQRTYGQQSDWPREPTSAIISPPRQQVNRAFQSVFRFINPRWTVVVYLQALTWICRHSVGEARLITAFLQVGMLAALSRFIRSIHWPRGRSERMLAPANWIMRLNGLLPRMMGLCCCFAWLYDYAEASTRRLSSDGWSWVELCLTELFIQTLVRQKMPDNSAEAWKFQKIPRLFQQNT